MVAFVTIEVVHCYKYHHGRSKQDEDAGEEEGYESIGRQKPIIPFEITKRLEVKAKKQAQTKGGDTYDFQLRTVSLEPHIP